MNPVSNLFSKLKFGILWRYREASERNYLLSKGDVVAIYTMGKVGSTSIYFALKNKLGAKVLFVHRMLDENIMLFNQPFITANVPVRRYQMAQFINRHLLNREQVKIISVIREPMTRNISAFFQNFSAYNHGKTFEEIPVEQAIQNFINNFRHHMPEFWIHQEFLKKLDLSLSDLEFNPKIKHTLISKNNIELLILRIDLEDNYKEKIISKFVNTPIQLKRENTHQQKNYKQYYQLFRDQIVIPESVINKVYNATYLSTFYSKEEIQFFKNSWLDKLSQ